MRERSERVESPGAQLLQRAQPLNIKAQLSSLWAKGCMLMVLCGI